MPETARNFTLVAQRAPDAVIGADTPGRPLAGLTVLAVEDSRYASEALRLVCSHSGARLRRADCIASAWRHLRCYRPDVLVVDLGLPDGNGADLIAALGEGPLRPRAVVAISGQPGLGPAAISAGADAFLEKPIPSVAVFQSLVLHLAAPGTRAPSTRGTSGEGGAQPVVPDPIALRDDLAQAARMLADRPNAEARRYIAGFLASVAISADDPVLARAAEEIAPARGGRRAAQAGRAVRDLSHLVGHRLARGEGDPLGTSARAEGQLRPVPRRR